MTLPATRCFLCLEPHLLDHMVTTTIGHAVGVTVCGDCFRCERTVRI